MAEPRRLFVVFRPDLVTTQSKKHTVFANLISYSVRDSANGDSFKLLLLKNYRIKYKISFDKIISFSYLMAIAAKLKHHNPKQQKVGDSPLQRKSLTRPAFLNLEISILL